jgi:phosphate transport system protein
LDREIQMVKDEILLLGSLVEQAMLNAVDALKRRDVKFALEVEHGDDVINEKRFAIENRVLILLATQQPLARDLRFMAAVFEINTELERMGDYAKGIAKVARRIDGDETPIPMREISHAADLAVSMLHRALGAFIVEDVNQAYSIPEEDDQVDDLYNLVYHKLIASMIANPDTVDHGSLVMWVIHDIERFADRVTNICERTVFIATGELMEIAKSDEEWDKEENEG